MSSLRDLIVRKVNEFTTECDIGIQIKDRISEAA